MQLNITTLHSECVPLKEHMILQKEVLELKTKLTTLTSNLASKDELIIKLLEQLKLIQNLHFGKQSEIGEKILDNTNTDISDDVVIQNIAAYKRRRGKKSGRLVDMSKLPRYKVIHDLPLECQSCAGCGSRLKYFGQDKSEQLEIIPKLVYCVEHIRYKYTCNNCEQVTMAPKPQAPLLKAEAGISLIAEVIINKILYHLPLYRQSKILFNYGIDIPDNTIGNWIMEAGDALLPLEEALWQEVQSSKYLQVDETPVKVLNPEKKAYVWVYHNPLLKFVVYDFALSRAGDNPNERLKNFKGKLQTDGYKAYNTLHNSESVIHFGCNAHGRRKFADVLKITKNKTGIAAQAILKLQEIYAVETEARENQLDYVARKRLRQEKAKPLWEQYKTLLQEQVKLVPPKSKLGQALQYTLNLLPYLIAYLEHGEVEIDNNLVENLIRVIALGRRNWLFIGHKNSGKIYMLYYSLVQGCILQEINPRIYIHYILTKVHELRRGKIDPKSLLPHIIDRKILEAFEIELAKEHTRVLNNLVYPDTS